MAGSLKSRHQQHHPSSETLRENPSLPLLASGGSRHSCVEVVCVFSPLLSLEEDLLLLYRMIFTSPSSITFTKAFFSEWSHIFRFWMLGHGHICFFGGAIFRLLQVIREVLSSVYKKLCGVQNAVLNSWLIIEILSMLFTENALEPLSNTGLWPRRTNDSQLGGSLFWFNRARIKYTWKFPLSLSKIKY